jgi:hypothetical protein
MICLPLPWSSCKKDFIDLNTDPNGTPMRSAAATAGPGIGEYRKHNMLRARNFNNELMQVTVDAGDSEGKVFQV